MIAYLPTVWAIHVNADSSQHSLVTWISWLGANITMAAWLYESNGREFDKAIIVTIGNATMCFTTILVITRYRFIV